MDKRPDPDQLLKRVQAEESARIRGKLKLFFGACPGVGKTYAMLEAARQRKKEGVDVVVGVVETHGRAETAALLEGLEVLPRRTSDYKGVTIDEFDLDAALARRPSLILVDELAHTNAPGSRHVKRWQDVDELLGAGIDVYTALNVQHWESLNDVVAQITGVIVQEKVPDTFLEHAHELELVDLPPEELLTRLKEGKVYRGAQAAQAADHFFKPGNLLALRELALRHAAERVDAQMQAFKETNAIDAAWPVSERLLVGVTGSPLSARLLRATSRLATRLRAPWIAVHVETPAFLSLAPESRGRVMDHLRLAQSLGAETVTLSGQDVTEELLVFARSRDVTKIVLGKPAEPRWKEWLFGSIVTQLARRSGEIDLYVISGTGSEAAARRLTPGSPPTPWPGIRWGTGVVVLCTGLSWLFLRSLDPTNLAMIYLLGVCGVAYRFGHLPAVVVSVLSVLSFDFFFVPPVMTFAISDTQYLMTFVVMLGVGLFISTVTGRLRAQTEAMRHREERLRRLHRLSRALSETPNSRDVLTVAARELTDYYRCPVVLLAPNEKGQLVVAGGDREQFDMDANDVSVASWVFDRDQPAGAGTDTLNGSKGLFIPMKGSQSTVGVLGLRPPDPTLLQLAEQWRLLETFAVEIGGALESTRLSETAGRAEVQMEVLAISSGTRNPVTKRFADFLDDSRIRIFPVGIPYDRILKELVGSLSLPNPVRALQAILERERAGATDIAPGLAVPHARLPGLSGIQVALGISPADKTRVTLLFLGPADDPRAHLAFLSLVARFFQDPQRVDTLSRFKTAADILDFVRTQD